MASSELLELQSKCRKDADSYQVEFQTQYRQYQALISSARLCPSLENRKLEHLSSFVAHVSSVYPEEGATAAKDHVELLSSSGTALHADLRRALVKSLAIMHRKGAISVDVIVPVMFHLLVCEDKQLRKMLSADILSSIKFVNKKHTNEKLNRIVQKFLYTTVQNSNEVLVKRSLNISVELFRRRIWNDEKTANVIASGVFHPATEVMVVSARFLLESEERNGGDDDASDEDDESESDNENEQNVGSKAKDLWKLYNMTGKKTTRKTARVKKAMEKIQRKKKSKSSRTTGAMRRNPFSPAMLLNDPQDFTERLLSDLQTRRKGIKYEQKLLLMNLITRLIGTHELLLLNLYPFLQRYLQPHQDQVTLVLTYLTQACHPLVPPDVLHPILRALADNFVSDRCSEEVMAVGLNSVRAICARVPLAIEVSSEDEESRSALLRDLVGYKTHRDKGVNMAARSLLQLYREVNPKLLLKKDRGKEAAAHMEERVPAQYGATKVPKSVPGMELLEDDEAEDESESESEGESEDDVDGAVEDKVEDDDEDEVETEGTDAVEVDAEDGTEDHRDEKDGDDKPQVVVILSDSESDDDGEGSASTNSDESKEASEQVDEDAAMASGKAKVETSNELREVEDCDVEKEEETDANGEDREAAASLLDVASSRILSDDDFRRIQARATERKLSDVLGHKRALTDGAVDTNEIDSYCKKTRRTLEERLATVRAGREGREKFGSKKNRKDKKGGSTNKQKQKMKQTGMVLHKIRRKGKSKGGKQRKGKGRR